MKTRNSFVSKLPYLIVILFLIFSFWLSLRATSNYILLMVGQFQESIPVFIPFGNPLEPGLLGLIGISFISIIGWLISTKLKPFQSMKWRVFIFFQMIIGITFYYTWFITAPVYNFVIPYLQERVSQIDLETTWQPILIGNTDTLMIFLMFIPSIAITLLFIWLGGQYSQHNESLKEAFEEFEFKSRFLQRFFKLGDSELWPDIVLGPESKTKELVTQPGKDRTLNNCIIGSIGTGKTAALVLPILNQDLHWMARFINRFPYVYSRSDYETESVRGMFFNGISVIEPSNDLCEKTYQLVKAHNIPDEAVFYIDPTNPNTPSINPMQGPVDQVAEAFAMVIEGLAEGANNNFFFQQSERNHLKHYIYLLKLHDPGKNVTFDMLLDMYNNPQLVRHMHLSLKETFPESIETILDRDERNHWKIVQQIDEWFDMNLQPKSGGRGGAPVQITHGKYRGEVEYYDAKQEHVVGLRNILNDIGANKLIRRVLFGDSNFNFDRHLEYGGVLLCNTAKGELSSLSNVLGKLILLSLQNAVFRRKPNTTNFHHILIDEFPDYIYRPFKEFPAQSRKYKVILTIVAQTTAQLADKYGNPYMDTLLGSFRHKMVYGDIPSFDAELFSKLLGEKERYEETQSEQTVSPLQESPITRAGSSYAKTKEAILSPSELIYQKPFQAAIKIVENNRPMPVRQIDANFVPKEEFKKAIISVEPDSASIWLKERSQSTIEMSEIVTEPIDEAEEGESEADILEHELEGSSETIEKVMVVEPAFDNAEFYPQKPVEIVYTANSRLRKREKPIELTSSDGEIWESKELSEPTDSPPKEETNVIEETPLPDYEKEEVIHDDYNPLNDIFGPSSEPTVSELSEEHKDLMKEIKKQIDETPSTQNQRVNPLDLESMIEDFNKS